MADYDLSINQAASFTLKLIWKADTLPVDLTGATAKMKIKTKLGAPAVLELTELAGITIDGVEGSVTIDLTPAQTILLTRIEYVYDLFVTVSTTTTKLLDGKIAVELAVSI